MSNKMISVSKNRGLHTFRNLFGLPPGALTVAENVVIDRDDVVEPRRGFAQYGTVEDPTTVRIKQLFDYKNRILRHTSENVIQYDSDNEGTFVNFAGTFEEASAGTRIKGIEANGNFYFLSDSGTQKISVATAEGLSSAVIRDAGGVRATSLSASVDYGVPGFLLAQNSVSYKVVWGITDANDNLNLGVPSEVTTVTNFSSSSALVTLTFAIPAEVYSTDYFFQIYRTNINASDPGLEFNLVYEDFAPSLPPGTISIQDNASETYRDQGAPLYTNPTSGDGKGTAGANYRPPFAKDIELFNGYTFYANTSTVQRRDLTLLSVDDFVSGTSNINITDGTTTRTYTFTGAFETYLVDFDVDGLGASADYLAGAGQPGLYFTLDAATVKDQTAERSYYVWYIEGSNEVDPAVAGKIGIQVTILGADTPALIAQKTMTAILAATDDFNIAIATDVLSVECSNNGWVQANPSETITNASFLIVKDDAGVGEDAASNEVFLPKVPAIGELGPTTAQQIDQASRSLIDVLNTDTSGLVYGYYLSDSTTVPGRMTLEQRVLTGSAFWFYANNAATAEEFNPTLPTSALVQDVISSNEVRPNRIYYSKFQQPEAVPLLNYIDVGPRDRSISRILALRDALYILKEDSIYRLTGETSPFQLQEYDSSVYLRSPDSAVVLNNQIYALTSQDVVTITDSQVSSISRQIEDKIKEILRPGFNFETATFGVSYESDRAYLLFVSTTQGGTVADVCYRYNTFTQTWTSWDVSKTCGLVKFDDDKLYVGSGTHAFIEQERKNLDITDYCDLDYSILIDSDAIDGLEVVVSDSTNVGVGDVIEQTQYLTIAVYNRALRKLDIDVMVNDTDYYSTLEFENGENPRTKVTALATKLDADTGITGTTYSTAVSDISGSITNVTVGADTTFTVTAGQVDALQAGRWVTLSGISTTPQLNGETYEVKSVNVGLNQFTIEETTTAVSDTTGTFATAITDFRDIQGCFNIIIALLNADSGVFFSNYDESEGTVQYKAQIDSFVRSTNTITLVTTTSLMEGPITLYKAISSTVEYAPQFAEDPTSQKQFPEASVVFEDNNFTNVSVGFATDLSPGFEYIDFTEQGTGEFGAFAFGEINFGGVAAPIPLRCSVPLQKQRARFLRVQVTHVAAMEKFSLFELIIRYRPYNTRNYKG